MDSKNNTGLTIRRTGLLKVIAGAAVVAAAMIYLLIYVFDSRASDGKPTTGSFVTRLGEHRCEKLPDASQVCLNTNTSVRFTFNRQTRNAELISGEASFEVQSGDRRPFDVLSKDLLVHDLGTSFNIYKKDYSTIVTVISGHVKVLAPVSPTLAKEFKDGAVETAWERAPDFYQLQQAEFDEVSGTLYVRRALAQEDLNRLTAWQQGRIDLNGKTLRDALVEFSRYHPIEKVSIPDRTLRDLHVGGEFLVDNFMDFLDSLEYTRQIHHVVEKGADGRMTVTVTRERVATVRSSGK
jgi:transmembrane sensor